jgi:hypothetical protein
MVHGHGQASLQRGSDSPVHSIHARFIHARTIRDTACRKGRAQRNMNHLSGRLPDTILQLLFREVGKGKVRSNVCTVVDGSPSAMALEWPNQSDTPSRSCGQAWPYFRETLVHHTCTLSDRPPLSLSHVSCHCRLPFTPLSKEAELSHSHLIYIITCTYVVASTWIFVRHTLQLFQDPIKSTCSTGA